MNGQEVRKLKFTGMASVSDIGELSIDASPDLGPDCHIIGWCNLDLSDLM